jgi:hypothetical protein
MADSRREPLCMGSCARAAEQRIDGREPSHEPRTGTHMHHAGMGLTRRLTKASLMQIPAAAGPSWHLARAAGQRRLSTAALPSFLPARLCLAVPQKLLAAPSRGMGSASASRPFRVLGLQQIAVGAESKDDMRRIWQVSSLLRETRRHKRKHKQRDECNFLRCFTILQ